MQSDRTEKRTCVVLGISGGTGSGKTTIAQEIARCLGPDNSVIIHQDSYYLDRSLLPCDTRVNFDHPSAFDSELLKKHLCELRSGQAVDKPVYSFHTNSRMSETIKVEPKPVMVVEGILVLEDAELRRIMDIKVYVDADADVRFIRRLDRDLRERGRSIESVVDQYMSTVRPMHLQFVEPSKRYADIIIPEGGHNSVALDMIIARLRAML
jgi:uridine kinase